MSYAALRRGRVSLPGQIYLVTTVTRQRRPVFRDLTAGRAVVRELRALQQEGWADTLCYVLMPDHLHWLIQLHAATLPEVMRWLKGRTSRALGGRLWQPNYHDHALRREEEMLAAARYVVAHPVRAGLVERVGDYPLWDAVWF